MTSRIEAVPCKQKIYFLYDELFEKKKLCLDDREEIIYKIERNFEDRNKGKVMTLFKEGDKKNNKIIIERSYFFYTNISNYEFFLPQGMGLLMEMRHSPEIHKYRFSDRFEKDFPYNRLEKIITEITKEIKVKEA